MFYGAISDFFAQAVISFLLGHRNLAVFSEFLETLTSEDASSVVRLDRIRSVGSEIFASLIYIYIGKLTKWQLKLAPLGF